MRFKILGILATVALLSACETAGEADSDKQGSGSVADAKPVETYTTPLPKAGGTMIRPGTQEDLVANVGDRVFFAFDKFHLDSIARSSLDKQAAWLKANPSAIVTVEGHCDERGTREYNLALGERRANSVKDYLIALGINPIRVNTISYGKERPVALGSNEAAWAQNRRGVTVVTSAGS